LRRGEALVAKGSVVDPQWMRFTACPTNTKEDVSVCFVEEALNKSIPDFPAHDIRNARHSDTFIYSCFQVLKMAGCPAPQETLL
jgi:hypothetical protein